MRPGRTAAWPQTSAVCGAEEAGSELSCSAAVREISKLLMGSKERHGGVNRHPEIKSNQLEEASWQRSWRRVGDKSFKWIHPSCHAPVHTRTLETGSSGEGRAKGVKRGLEAKCFGPQRTEHSGDLHL